MCIGVNLWHTWTIPMLCNHSPMVILWARHPRGTQAQGGEYLVEKILGHRVQGGEEQYLAQWEGFQEPSWHPVKDFINDELMEYWEKTGLTPQAERTLRKGKTSICQ